MNERVMFEVIVSLDPAPGTFHTTESAAECLQAILLGSIGHYNPVVMPARPQGDPTDTPCVDGCGQDAATIERLRGQLAKVEAALTRVEALVGRWEDPGLVCECGHDLGQHNSLGCYARITYRPEVVVCDCAETDDRYEDDFAIRDLRAALSPQDVPSVAADAPEAPGQPGRGEDAAQGDSEVTDMLAALQRSIEDANARRLGR